MNIDHPTETAPLRQLWKEAFGDTDEFLDLFFSTAYHPDRCLQVVENGETAAALYWMDCEADGRKLAYLYAVATAKKFRRQGIFRKLMEKTHRILQNQGYSGILLVPGEESLASFYRPMGYEYCCEIREFVCARGPEAEPLRPIDAGEYARLRRELLPPGGVRQEGEALAFLETQAEFFAGTHWLLAARRQDDRLFGLELLGNTTVAPGILTALGCAEGTFRTPGPGRPYAMYCPLTPSPAPTCFSFGFDA